MNSKKWLRIFVVLSFIGVGFIILFNYHVDSYSIFKNDYSKVVSEPNQNFLKMNFLINKKHTFDSFIFGSSRVGKINPINIKNGNYYNMTYSEGVPLEHLSNIKLLIKNNIPIKNILIGLDDFSYEVNPLQHKNQPMRQPHYDTDINNMSKMSFYMYYLFKIPSFFDISRLSQQIFLNRVYPTYNYDIYKSRLPLAPKAKNDYIENNREEHINDKKFMQPMRYTGNRIKETINTIKEIVNLSIKHKFKLIIFINPIHKTTYLDTDFSNFQLFKSELVKLANYYDFSGLNKITTNNYYYYETSHYRDIAGELIKQRLFGLNYDDDFGAYVTKDNIYEHLISLQLEMKAYSQNKD